MKTLSKIGIGAVALTMLASTPAAAQNYRDRDRDNTGRDAVIGAVVGGLAGAVMGQGDGRYVAGGALAGAALGAAANGGDRGGDCNYYRGGRCYRNQGHWEREHGINSKDRYYGDRYDRRDRYDRHYDRRSDYRRDRDYRYDRRW